MLLILEATAGPVTGRRIEVPPGSVLRIGRTPKSDYAIGEDSYLSGQHFSVEWDGNGCIVRDLGSSNGTFLNGARITEAPAKEGDSIVAGGSTFTVRVEAFEPQATAVHVSAMAAPAREVPQYDHTLYAGSAALGTQWLGFSSAQVTLLTALYRQGETVFALLDSSRDSRIPAFVDAAGERYARIGASLLVVELPSNARLLDVLVKDGWGRSWGFYFTSGAGLDVVCRHWANYAVLRNDAGAVVSLRFWDPRILRLLLVSLPAAEVAEFFGPVGRVIAEGEKPENAVEFTPAPRGAQQQTITLA